MRRSSQVFPYIRQAAFAKSDEQISQILALLAAQEFLRLVHFCRTSGN